MRTKIALTIQLLIHGDFNCAAVETGESRKMSRCSRPQPTITFSATESFHNQLRNPGLWERLRVREGHSQRLCGEHGHAVGECGAGGDLLSPQRICDVPVVNADY
jgi:hypothetical protein